MRNRLLNLTKILDGLSGFFLGLAGVLCLALVLLTCQQVLARYLFNASSIAMQELEWHFFGAIFLFGLAATLRDNEHVRVDVIHGKLSGRSRQMIEFIGLLLCVIPTCAVIIWTGISFVQQSMQFPSLNKEGWLEQLVDKESYLQVLLRQIELWINPILFLGEVSPNPGGLPARWLAKSLIPFGFALLLLQSLAQLLKIFTYSDSSK